MVPVRAWLAVNWRALASTAYGVPVEVVWALLRAADALTDRFVKNFIILAFFRAALALAHVGVHILIRRAGAHDHVVVALATARIGVPEEVIWAVVGCLGLCTEATALSRVEVVRWRALVRVA